MSKPEGAGLLPRLFVYTESRSLPLLSVTICIDIRDVEKSWTICARRLYALRLMRKRFRDDTQAAKRYRMLNAISIAKDRFVPIYHPSHRMKWRLSYTPETRQRAV